MTSPCPKLLSKALHLFQKYGEEPYTVHLEAVVEVLREHGFDSYEVIAGGYLHDAVEDTYFETYNILYNYGEHVAFLVEFCTDCDGANRKERKAKTYQKQMELLEGDRDYLWKVQAVAIKVADRIANVSYSDRRLLKMYKKEQADFESTLRGFPENESLWETLNLALEGS